MHDARLVRDGQAPRDLYGVIDNLSPRQRLAALQAGSKGLPLEQFHDHERRAVGGADGPDIVNGEDVGMVERTGSPRFFFEALLTSLVAAERVRQDLDGDETTQAGVARAVHLAHAAFANQFDDLVRPKTLPGRQRRRREQRARIIRVEKTPGLVV